MGEWYYIGHYGQLGPLTREQIDDLIQGGVIVRETYVWRTGMSEWLRADSTSELLPMFTAMQPSTPPPPPLPGQNPPPPRLAAPVYMNDMVSVQAGMPIHPTMMSLRSDKSRIAGALLQFIPGVGRIYLGHSAIGVMQIVATVFCGVGLFWSWIDGICILLGSVRYDGYGRLLKD